MTRKSKPARGGLLREGEGIPGPGPAQDASARYEDFIRSTADWIWEVDDKLNYVFLSREVARIFGVPSQSLLGSYIFSLSYFRNVDRSLLTTVEAIEDRIPFRNRRLSLTDGRGVTRTLLLSGVPVFDPESGGFIGYRGTGSDVTAERQGDQGSEELREALEQLARLDSSWHWEADDRLRLTALSEGYHEHAGLLPGQSLGRSFANLWNLDESALSQVAGRRPFRHRHCIWRHGGLDEERNFVIAGQPEFDERGDYTGYRGVGRDVTEEYRAAAGALSEALEAADRANRAKTEFLTNISHEMRTPLNAIIGFSDAMRSEVLGAMRNKKYLRYAEDIHASAGHLLDIVNEILDLARIETGKIRLDEQVVDLGDLVESCRRMVDDEVRKFGLEFETNLPDDLPALRADPVKLKQVVLNLLSNAVKFTPPGGTIAVGATVTKAGDLEIEVRDTGIGIKDEDIEKILSRYGQGEGTAVHGPGGIGLGLPITKGLVELHGGSLSLVSGEGTGTRAIVRLPAERLTGDEPDEKWKILF